MMLPQACRPGRWLFPPAVRVEEVRSPVAVDVAHTETVADVDAPRTRLGDRRGRPHRRRVCGIPLRSIERGETERVEAGVNQVRLAVARDVLEERLLVTHRLNGD